MNFCIPSSCLVCTKLPHDVQTLVVGFVDFQSNICSRLYEIIITNTTIRGVIVPQKVKLTYISGHSNYSYILQYE